MKLFLTFLIMALFAPFIVLAQDVLVPIVTNEQFLISLVASIGGATGLKTMGIVALAVQVLMKFLGTPWADSLMKNNGQWKLTAYLVFTLVGGVVGLMVSGLSFGAAFVHSGTLAALGVLANQLYKQFLVKAD